MTTKFPLQKTEEEWRLQLSAEQYRILREKGTERPGTGKWLANNDKGTYNCAACENPLYNSNSKFDAHCGWLAFWDTIPGSITYVEDNTLGMHRVEIMCSNCGGHLGHVFKGEGYGNPKDERHCVNSVSVGFTKE